MRSSAVLPNKYDKILNFLEVTFKNLKKWSIGVHQVQISRYTTGLSSSDLLPHTVPRTNSAVCALKNLRG